MVELNKEFQADQRKLQLGYRTLALKMREAKKSPASVNPYATPDNVGAAVDFRALYIQQDVLAKFKNNYRGLLTPYDLLSVDQWLWLRSLTSLTISEMIKICESIGLKDVRVEGFDNPRRSMLATSDDITVVIWMDGTITVHEEKVAGVRSPVWIYIDHLYQRLRSLGFALPWRDLSVEDQINRNYIKILNR